MVANLIQHSLFVVLDEAGEFKPVNDEFAYFDDLARKQKKKRIHYSCPSFRKCYKNDVANDFIKDDVASWGRMEQVYIELANFFPLLFKGDVIHDFGLFRIWVEDYGEEKYMYPLCKGKLYKGQIFKFVTCEIIGSELLLVEQRLELHEKALNMLKNKCDMVDVEKYIKEYLDGCGCVE